MFSPFLIVVFFKNEILSTVIYSGSLYELDKMYVEFSSLQQLYRGISGFGTYS